MKKRNSDILRAILLFLGISVGMFAADFGAGGAFPVSVSAAETDSPQLTLDNAITMIAGSTYTLNPQKKNITGKLTWKSSNKNVVTVTGSGKLTAKKKGTAKITVSSGSARAVCKVTVQKVTLNKKSVTVTKGKTTRLKVSGTSWKVTWKSSNPSVASVNSSGKVTAKKTGTAKITATVGVSKVVCKVTVKYTRWDKLLDQYRDDDGTNQLVFVKYTGGSKALVQMYVKSAGKWSRLINCYGYVGQNGINKVKEGDRKTPTGTFNLTGAFGIKNNPGAKMSYVKVNRNLYWCGDKKYYNQLIDITKVPHTCQGEHLIDYSGSYDYGMFLDYNKECIYKKGSAIFLHCKSGNPYTAGCIAVSKNNMIKIIRNAEPGAKICIYLGN